MIHLECFQCEGHPLCRGPIDKMSTLLMTRNIEEATCKMCFNALEHL